MSRLSDGSRFRRITGLTRHASRERLAARLSVDIEWGCETVPAWFEERAIEEVFAFPWPPWDRRECTITGDEISVTIESRYKRDRFSEPAIFSNRSLVEDGGRIVAFHNALFLSEESQAQNTGYATEMLRRCMPFYHAKGARLVIIPSAVMAGRTVWPKVGFRVSDEIADGFRAHLRALHEEKQGKAFTGEVPLGGEELLGLKGIHEMPIGRMALRTYGTLTLELDLDDPAALQSLRKRGVLVP